MSIKQVYNDNLRKLPNVYGDFSVMAITSGYTLLSALVLAKQNRTE